mmetsp:Transcript_48706/g.76044  ORF Transcript_48706/g.76044 Transcript_48706/m.76044 type:complete len:174 (-) Transcript_48706:3965-4486(-)
MFVNSVNLSPNKAIGQKLNSICYIKKTLIRTTRSSIRSGNLNNKDFEKNKIETEKIIFEGPPSIFELIIPTLSILTVIGIIPFVATLTRQIWVQYKITNRRISVTSGFQGKDKVDIVYRDIKKVSFITRYWGNSADVVLVLKDNAQLELRSLPEWETNINYIKEQCGDSVEFN